MLEQACEVFTPTPLRGVHTHTPGRSSPVPRDGWRWTPTSALHCCSGVKRGTCEGDGSLQPERKARKVRKESSSLKSPHRQPPTPAPRTVTPSDPCVLHCFCLTSSTIMWLKGEWQAHFETFVLFYFILCFWDLLLQFWNFSLFDGFK